MLSARLEVPENKDAPIGAALSMATASGAAVEALFDWRQTGPQTWDIAIETANGSLLLSEGGNTLRLDGEVQIKARSEEHTSALQSLMRISYAVFCLKKKTNK